MRRARPCSKRAASRISRWKPDVSPDFEAFTRSKDDRRGLPRLLRPLRQHARAGAETRRALDPRKPNRRSSFSIASAYSGNGIIEQKGSVAGKIEGWAVNHSRLENVEDFSEAQWNGIQFDISVRQVIDDDSEMEVDRVAATMPSPPDMPAEWLEDRQKRNHGFSWEIPEDLQGVTLRVYAVHPFLEHEEVLLVETAANAWEPEGCNSTPDWLSGNCEFACECQPACLCTQ